jgi:hypothetical protein
MVDDDKVIAAKLKASRGYFDSGNIPLAAVKQLQNRVAELERENRFLRKACEEVVFDVKNQDQDSVHSSFRVICDNTAESCQEALSRKDGE